MRIRSEQNASRIWIFDRFLVVWISLLLIKKTAYRFWVRTTFIFHLMMAIIIQCIFSIQGYSGGYSAPVYSAPVYSAPVHSAPATTVKVIKVIQESGGHGGYSSGWSNGGGYSGGSGYSSGGWSNGMMVLHSFSNE